jgi:hypothetical protein
VSGISTTPTVSEADGQAVSEVDGRPARPWSMRSELEGSRVPTPVEVSEGGGMIGDAHGSYPKRNGELSPVAELPGSESWQVGGHEAAR